MLIKHKVNVLKQIKIINIKKYIFIKNNIVFI